MSLVESTNATSTNKNLKVFGVELKKYNKKSFLNLNKSS